MMKSKIDMTPDLLRADIYVRLAELNAEYARTEEPVPFSERLKLGYTPIREGEQWSDRLWDCGWFHITGEVPQPPQGTELCLLFDFEGEACVFSADGTPVRGLTNVSSDFDRALGLPGKRVLPFSDGTFATDKIDLWIETGNNDLFGVARGGRLLECAVAACNTALRDLYYDFRFLQELMQSLPDTDPQHYSIAYALEKVSVNAKRGMSQEEIACAREILRKELERKNISDPLLTFRAIGHSHLDLAWLWPVRETRRKAGRTFSTALANIAAYPDYIFGASQPQQFAWVKEDYPALFEKIKDAVAKNRIELQGGMWVEADTNVTGGESLVRQFLYGKKFWKEEFGKDTDILWLPDVFGFSGALPQIMRGCGCKNFLTIKLSWNSVNEFPYHSFRWQGIDGSEVLVHMPPEGTYNSSASPKAVRAAQAKYAERGLSGNAMMLYGIGDGGGGPGFEHLEFVKREKDICGVPPVKGAPAEEFFAQLQKEAHLLPSYRGELYLERHQGTYTSQAKNKYYNRRMEVALEEYEFAQVAAGISEREKTEKIWKEILLYQFHDILPGSSIRRVYCETDERYAALLSETESSTLRILADGEGEKCVLNTAPFAVSTFIKDGTTWRKAEADPYSVTKLGDSVERFSVYADERVIGNDLIEAEFGEDGAIARLNDKTTGENSLSRPSGRFALYIDTGNAWDFYPGYLDTVPELFTLVSVRPFLDGAQAGIVQEYRGGNSRITQTVIVTEGSPLVRCDVTVDWQESQKMLRADFYPKAQSDEVTCDIQWGNIRRTTRDNGSIDRAQFEICAHKWVDVSEKDSGFAVLNDSKYGYRCKNGCISIDLLRSEEYPCVGQDRGIQKFSYALYGHRGDLEHSDVAEQAYLFNRPLKLIEAKPQSSLASSSDRHVVIETVKPAENGNGFVVRLYNDSRYATETVLSVRGQTVAETDMLENDLRPCDGSLYFRPFEIKTVRCK